MEITHLLDVLNYAIQDIMPFWATSIGGRLIKNEMMKERMLALMLKFQTNMRNDMTYPKIGNAFLFLLSPEIIHIRRKAAD